MGTTNMSYDVRKAQKKLAEITDLLGKLSYWTDDEAEVMVKKLYDDWRELCRTTNSATEDGFEFQCNEILGRCKIFRMSLVKKGQGFSKKVMVRLRSIPKSAGDNKEINSLTSGILKLWNEVEQPRLVFIYEKTEELESRIRDMMEFAVQPIETATETTK